MSFFPPDAVWNSQVRTRAQKQDFPEVGLWSFSLRFFVFEWDAMINRILLLECSMLGGENMMK